MNRDILIWTDAEDEVIRRLSAEQELSREQLIRQGLRIYQLYAEGLIDINWLGRPKKKKEG